MKKVRAGVVGLGKWAEVIAAAVSRSDGIETAACASSSPEKAAAFTGKHVFVEKPIATNIPDAHSVIAECERAGVVLATGQMTRRMTAVRKMK
ncbi:MAG: Gfo/Idh/MocA family oxidoreductase [Nitrospinota bacterium]|jgi:predicted dehydrogenase|nr:Gfo/Idh/MocA family oxidoreductase [Nitrospinota bacterium]MDP6620058.1 Gfo/Idh/MocA family oxidoreductase [Nitrospinota bacterium]